MKPIDLWQGDCLELMKNIPDGSVDLVLTDPPYGTTACKWDSVIPFEPMWEQLNRIIKSNGAICLFGSEPFSSALRMSNIKHFKYDWYWKKSRPNGWQHAKNKPMTSIETISVFSLAPMGHKSILGDNRMKYNPQGVFSVGEKQVSAVKHGRIMGARPNQVGKKYEAMTGFPQQCLFYANITGARCIHPTQKPVALLEYLIRTYTNEGETVLDFTMGSGSTGVACVNTNRHFIGIELDEGYFNIATQRIDTALKIINT